MYDGDGSEMTGAGEMSGEDGMGEAVRFGVISVADNKQMKFINPPKSKFRNLESEHAFK